MREKFRRIGVYNKHSKSSLVCERILHVSLYVNLCRFGQETPRYPDFDCEKNRVYGY